ncbi:MAG: M28 family peptidase [Candidatus Omnitrophica bacterium]|nr:M28 family peptidase [Candidatus Omnitrophota bacterium]
MDTWRSKLFFLLFLLTGAASGGFSADPAMQSALNQITEDGIRQHVKYLASDALEGRGVGSKGEQLAVDYIAEQFKSMGLKPGTLDGSYFQKVPMIGLTADPSMFLQFHCDSLTVLGRYGVDYIANSTWQTPQINLSNKELVFVGYGIQAPEFGWDDYKGADLRGKILLFMNNDPDQGDPEFFGGKARLYYGRWTYKYEMAAKMGADGAIIIHTTPSAGYPWQVVQSSWMGERLHLLLSEPRTKMEAWVTEDKIRRILMIQNIKLDDLYAAAEKPDFRPVELGVTVSIKINTAMRELEGANVLGLLPGKDPQKKNEAVIVTAHHDHLGKGKPIDGDDIYNGALDNASGVAMMMAVAKACVSMPTAPDRSMLFLSVTAEEAGLLGSSYYSIFPTFLPASIAAAFNIDGVNIWGKTKDITVLGWGKTTMDPIICALADLQGRVVRPDQMSEQGLFYRSDHFSFAKIGVPSLMFDAGFDFVGKPEGWGKKQIDEYIEKRYHQPSDEYDPGWNLEGAIEDAKLIFQALWQVAYQNEMPQWIPGDEFESIRLNDLQQNE